MGRDLGECALVGSLEIIHVEIALHYLGLAEEARREDATILELTVVAYGIVAGVELLGSLLSFGEGLILELTLGLNIGAE